ncbi:DUF262 domain-containing protein [Oceanobacillus sp. M60]
MDFDARSNSIKGLLTATRLYRIPRFQRDFSWEQNNYDEFLNDMLFQINFTDSKFKASQYYLGNMLFLGEKDEDFVEVIDGQQRLTTITILLAALRNTLFSISTEKDDSAHAYAETIQNEYLIKKIDGENKRKLHTMSSYPYFTQTIQDYKTKNGDVEPQTEEEELLKKTFTFFCNILKKDKYLKKINTLHKIKIEEKDYIEALKILRDQVLKSEVIEVFVSDREQANKIFENINSKGKPLSQVDLIKNSIFSRIEITEGGVDEMSNSWTEFHKKISGVDTDFNEFFLHYWKAFHPKDSANGRNLYNKFIKKYGVYTTKEEIQTLITDIKKSLDIYVELIKPDANNYRRQEKKAEEEFLTSITLFKGVQVRVALLSLYKTKIQLSQKEKIKFLKFLSDFHFAAFGTSLKIRSNKTSQPYRKFSTSMAKAKDKKDVLEAIQKLKSSLLELLTKEAFIEAFKDLRFDKKEARLGFSSFPAQYAIKQISNQLEGRLFNDSDYSIEHIIDESIDETNVNIGNLIVLENKYNQEVNSLKQKNHGEIEYTQKLHIYNQSKYKMMQDFIKEYNAFSTEDIDKRAIQLAEIFWSFFNK